MIELQKLQSVCKIVKLALRFGHKVIDTLRIKIVKSNHIVVVRLLSHVQLFVTPCTVACQASLSFTGVCQIHVHWVSHAIQPSHPLLLLSRLQSFPASGSFPMSQLLSGQRIGTSAPVLPKNVQDWFPLGLTSLSSLQSKWLSGVSSSITIRKHQFFSTQFSLWSNSHIRTWLLEKS